MLSNQILQSTLDGLKVISNLDLRVLDSEGAELASTAGTPFEATSVAREFTASGADTQEIRGSQYFKVTDDGQTEFILVVDGSGENTYVLGKMITYQLQGLLTAYKEHFDRDNFIKNLLLDNLLIVDIYGRAKKLRIRNDVKRVSMVVVCRQGLGSNMQELAKSCTLINADDFVTEVDADNVVIVKTLQDGADNKSVMQLAEQLVAYFEKEGLDQVHVAYGTTVSELREVSKSLKEAKLALEVGRIFSTESKVVCYTELGIGRLIYQLPIPLCKMFIKEIFETKKPDAFDVETLQTIEKFFENNLNVSETSRQLFIHRNTLVYRLDKLQKATGLDLRVFEDAITFKIAMMVVKYMNYMEKADI